MTGSRDGIPTQTTDPFAEYEAEEAAKRGAAFDRNYPAMRAKMAREQAKMDAGVGVETDQEREAYQEDEDDE